MKNEPRVVVPSTSNQKDTFLDALLSKEQFAKVSRIAKGIPKKLGSDSNKPVSILRSRKDPDKVLFHHDGMVVGTYKNGKVSIHTSYWKKEQQRRQESQHKHKQQKNKFSEARKHEIHRLGKFIASSLIGRVPRDKFDAQIIDHKNGILEIVFKSRHTKKLVRTVTIFREQHGGRTTFSRTIDADELNDDSEVIRTMEIATEKHGKVHIDRHSLNISLGGVKCIVSAMPRNWEIKTSDIRRAAFCPKCIYHTQPITDISNCCICFGHLIHTYCALPKGVLPKYTKEMISEYRRCEELRKTRAAKKQAKMDAMTEIERINYYAEQQVLEELYGKPKKKEPTRRRSNKQHRKQSTKPTTEPLGTLIGEVIPEAPKEEEVKTKTVKPTTKPNNKKRHARKRSYVETKSSQSNTDDPSADMASLKDVMTLKTKDGKFIKGKDAIRLLFGNN